MRSRLRLLWWSAGSCLLSASLTVAAGNAVPLLERRVAENPDDIFAWNRLAGLYLEELRETGDPALLAKARQAAEISSQKVDGPLNPGGLAARARVELASHQFAAARASALSYLEIRGDKGTGWQLLYDAEFELGNYAEAEKALDEMEKIDGEPTVASASRRAQLALLHGERAKCREHLESALALVQKYDNPEPATEAWCRVNLGELAFGQGDWETAENQYTAALKPAPGWFAAEEHLAELRGAQGRVEEAAAAYQKLIARVERPDLCQALGDLYAFAGDRARSQPWYDKARTGYRRSLDAGELLYLHHATGFYTDSVGEAAPALEAAQRDLQGRKSIYAWDALAWAQYTKGDFKEAAVSIEKALSTGVRNAHILYHAGMIRMSLGDLSAGRSALRATAEINPRYATFHVHR